MPLSFPDDCRYADSHEYARVEGDLVRVGISAYAVDQLGDIVFVDLPAVGAGVVEARNEAVLDSPEQLQSDPYGEGWLLQVRAADPAELEALMDTATYRAKVEGH